MTSNTNDSKLFTAEITAISNTSVSNNQHHIKPDEYLSTIIFLKWGMPITAVIGLLGNSVTIALMRRPKIRACVMSIYFTALSVMDMIMLVNLILMRSQHLHTGYHMYNLSGTACAILRFIQTVTYSVSSWLVTLIAVERSLVVAFPLKAPLYSTVKRATVTTSATILIITALSTFTLVTSDVQTINGKTKCSAKPQYQYFERYIRFQLMGVLTSYIPLAILVVCNCLLIYNIIQSKRKRINLTASSGFYNIKQFTYPAVAICVAFCFLTVPTMLYQVLSRIYRWEWNADTVLAFSIIVFLPEVRASINFFLYICTSGTFKTELLTMLFWRCRSKQGKQENSSDSIGTRMQDLQSSQHSQGQTST